MSSYVHLFEIKSFQSDYAFVIFIPCLIVSQMNYEVK